MANKKKGGVIKVAMVCETCKATNYYTSINKAIRPKISLKKYCKHCKISAIHNSREKLK